MFRPRAHKTKETKGNLPVRSRPEEKYLEWKPVFRAVFQYAFFYVRLRTYAQCASMNEFTCSEHSYVQYMYVKKTHHWKTALRFICERSAHYPDTYQRKKLTRKITLNRELKQVRTTTTLKKQSKFLYLKETMVTDYVLHIH